MQWKNAYETLHASLDQHRAEAARAKQELEVTNAELIVLRQVWVLTSFIVTTNKMTRTPR